MKNTIKKGQHGVKKRGGHTINAKLSKKREKLMVGSNKGTWDGRLVTITSVSITASGLDVSEEEVQTGASNAGVRLTMKFSVNGMWRLRSVLAVKEIMGGWGGMVFRYEGWGGKNSTEEKHVFYAIASTIGSIEAI
ncbi:hypothetical protein ACSQ67_003847 [Phaseolus vulgaris]